MHACTIIIVQLLLLKDAITVKPVYIIATTSDSMQVVSN